MSERGQKLKTLSEHKVTIAVISLALFIILTAVVSAIVITIVLGKRPSVSSGNPQYFSGSFRILSLNYTTDYKDRNSVGFKALSDQITNLLSSTFQNSTLKSQYNMSRIISIRAGSVIPQFVILINDYNTENKNSSSSAQRIVAENLINAKTSFEVDPTSVQLDEISTSDAEDMLFNAPNIYTVGTTVQALPQDYTACGIGESTLSGKIVGGTDASLGSWPWQARLLLNGNHKCGASLISDIWLVSAAHCFDSNKDVNLWTVVLGTIYLTTGPELKLQRITIYENYTSTTHANDIALLKLATSVNFTEYIRPVCLPETSDVFADGTSCYVTGWGLTKENGVLANILQQAEVKVINSKQCASSAMYGNYNFEMGPSMICAGYASGKIDSCQVTLYNLLLLPIQFN
uniref:Uncharacterized protein n=1 Tax=Leptobrachium leishanense TaxID=445787 RepID=A0A8C5M118_9ANUR